jgi:hypothetical protein
MDNRNPKIDIFIVLFENSVLYNRGKTNNSDTLFNVQKVSVFNPKGIVKIKYEIIRKIK